MIIVKKIFPFIMAFCLMFFSFPAVVLAGQAEWSIVWNDRDGTLQEEVIIYGMQDLQVNSEEWNCSESQGKLVLSREVKDWQAYNTLSDRFPLKARVKNLVIFKIITLKGQEDEVKNKGLYGQIYSQNKIKLTVEMPGIMAKSSAEQVKDYAHTWNLSPNDNQRQEDIMLRVIFPEGFYLGIAVFIIGFLVIIFRFRHSIKRIDKIIEEEYSLEKARAEIEEKKEGNAESEKDNA